jgi:hypothetical protein
MNWENDKKCRRKKIKNKWKVEGIGRERIVTERGEKSKWLDRVKKEIREGTWKR